MSERATAERYAQAILEAIVEQWQTTLTEVADALAQDPKLGANVDSIAGVIPTAPPRNCRTSSRCSCRKGMQRSCPASLPPWAQACAEKPAAGS